MKWYEEMAVTIDALNNSIINENYLWEGKHREKIDELIKYLPHGSGIDCSWEVDVTRSDVLFFSNSFHAMDEQGGYERWIEFTVKVFPSLQFGVELKITGNFGRRQEIKKYLHDIINSAVNKTILIN